MNLNQNYNLVTKSKHSPSSCFTPRREQEAAGRLGGFSLLIQALLLLFMDPPGLQQEEQEDCNRKD